MKKANNNINFYTAYRDGLREKKSSAPWTKTIYPFLLLVAVIAVVMMYLSFRNLIKSTAIEADNRLLQQMDVMNQEIQMLSMQSAELVMVADELENYASVVTALPLLDHMIFLKISECATDRYNISIYHYDELTRTLQINVSAPSVTDIPELVKALRDTALFSSTEYTGYTSDTDGRYFCTIGCVLAE